jgi:UDP-glucose 4-epimerase
LRLTNTYGPRQLIRHNRQGFIGWFIRKAVLGEKIEIFGDGKQVRDFNHVDDVVNALFLAATNKDCYGKYFNLGGEHINLLGLTKMLIELSGKGSYKLIPFPEDKKRIDIGDFYGDFKKFNELTGWKPAVSLREGFTDTILYYKKHKEHYL